MSPTVAPDVVPIPASHLYLLTRSNCGVFTTMGGNGQPQSSLVWVDHDGECARINTTLERQKGRNLLVNAKVSLLVVDPNDAAGSSRSGAMASSSPSARWNTSMP